eukprot:TRINITY_DN4651_c0_g1_i1.p1 TRINITY_DN4651_c0_g1~~TRINITY_DN4651_c0_g1_i1.p1  ORF type:complete len:629 (+),score=208.66 TRINITY_DN4651_c0_g1_i1:167-1888(+)
MSVSSILGSAHAAAPIPADEAPTGGDLHLSAGVKSGNPLTHATETQKILPRASYYDYSGAESPPEKSDSWPVSTLYVLAVELCERLAYYGATVVFFTYMRTMLEFDQSAANAVYNCFNFWAYGACLIGGYVADTYLGRVKAIAVFGMIYTLGYAALVLSAVHFTWSNYPDDPADGFAIPGFGIALFFIGLGTGGIKSNVSPLMADQIENRPPEVYASVFRWFYWAINVGSFVGILTSPLLYDNIGVKKRTDPSDPESDLSGTGYWASFLLPMSVFILSLLIFFIGKYQGIYVEHPPGGSVMSRCYRAALFARSERRAARAEGDLQRREHWLDWAKGSPEFGQSAYELKLAIRACTIFLWYPIYWMCYNQNFSNLVAQADLLERPSWIASEALNVVGSATLIVLIPVFEKGVFPMLRRAGCNLPPLVRISIGFALAAIAILYAATLEYYIHERGSFTSSGDYIPDGEKITIWWQIPPYFIMATSEIFASVGGLEFAYTESPNSMKSLVMSLYLCTNAVGSLLGIAVSPAMEPQNMVYVFFSLGGTTLLVAICFFMLFRSRLTRSQYDEIGGEDP